MNRISQIEKEYLKELGKQLNMLHHEAEQQKNLDRYKKINGLVIQRPPVEMFIPEQANTELFDTDQRMIQDEVFSGIENYLLRQIKRSQLLKVDTPMNRILYTGLFYEVTPWCDEYKTVRAHADGTSMAFEPCIKTYEDLKKLSKPRLKVDWKRTREQFERVSEVFESILDVRIGQPFSMTCGWGESMIDQLVEMRGLEQIYYDMVDAPEFIHEAMTFMTEAKIELLEAYKEQKALFLNHEGCLIGSCSHGETDELPGKEYNESHITEKNIWGFAQAQEFSSVSLEMLDEFVLPYQAKIINRFGLSTYGCCEPMDNRIDVISKHIKNLRILSISPYSDVKKAAEKCRGKFVMACKAHPSLYVNFEAEYLENYIKKLLLDTKGCCVTLNFAEIMRYDHPKVFLEIAERTQKVIDQYWEG